MGKKVKIGKQRKDVYYRRAKEYGYRARASFKLIQLNKTYNFLQSARVCIDLCAAPGSWMQVASKFMPVSSVIIGVDRFPIAPIPNTISIQGDITTEKVRQELRGNLKTWKADVILHDGAPNVGQNWLYDAYQQNLLVLHSFKLACEFLQKGGTFVTKVFRSRDHLSLQYVFRKLFKKVDATKPIASRFESAEIFVVCQGFLAPDKVDPEFFDPKYVFQTLEKEPKNTVNILKPEKTKKKAEGYEEGITMLFKKLKISDFIFSSKYIELLEEANEFEWDLAAAKESHHTTDDIIEYCKDLKVLNRKDIRILINWRKAIRADIEELKKQKRIEDKKLKSEAAEDKDEVDEDLEELEKIQEEIANLKAERVREDRQHKKKIEKKKKRLEEKLKLRLMVPGDPGPQEGNADGLFSLENINNIQSLDNIMDQSGDILVDADSENEDTGEKAKKMEYYSRSGTKILDSTGTYHKNEDDSDTEEESEDEYSEDEGLNIEMEELKEKKKSKKRVSFAENVQYNDDEVDDDTGKTNPLLTDLVGDKVDDRRERKAEDWFSKNIFDDVEDDDVEDFELETAIQKHEEAGGAIRKRARESEDTEKAESGKGNEQESHKKMKVASDFKIKDGPDSDSDSDSDIDSGVNSDEEEEEEEEGAPNANGPAEPPKKVDKNEPRLDSVGLALATKMIRSKKAMRDMYNDGWNRYMWGDEDDLPDWFIKDEKFYNSPIIKVDKEDQKMYENQNKAVDARTIKKVVEAKARKQRRVKKRMMKARKKAEVIANNADLTAREKAAEMNKIYKKAANMGKPKDKTYLVMKKCFGGKRPKGTKGPSKMVDRRLKKDKRANAKVEKKRKKK